MTGAFAVGRKPMIWLAQVDGRCRQSEDERIHQHLGQPNHGFAAHRERAGHNAHAEDGEYPPGLWRTATELKSIQTPSYDGVEKDDEAARLTGQEHNLNRLNQEVLAEHARFASSKVESLT